VNERDDALNEMIDRNLRDAHRQVHYDEVWAERVLREIACEFDSDGAIAAQTSNRSGNAWSKLSWPNIAALAAGLLLVVLSASWLASPSYRQQRKDSKESLVVELPKRLTEKLPERLTEKLPDDRQHIDPEGSRLQKSESVIAGSGYLAARISDDSVFEIYVVLPTRNTAGKFDISR